MSERMTNILGYLTLAAILAAIWILFGEDPTREQGARGQPTFEGLVERINETAQIRLSKADSTLSLTLVDGDWRVVERAGYTADQDKVLAFLRGFARSERREPKTANPGRFAALELGEAAVRVQLMDDTGGNLLDVQVGKRKEGGSGRSLTYIFQQKDTRAWLVSEIADVSTDPVDWLESEIVTIDEARIRAVTLNGVSLERSLNETDYRVADLAEGESSAASYKRAEPARTLARISLLDVQQTANPLMEPLGAGELLTHDGLRLAFTLFGAGEDRWLQWAADYSSDRASDGEAGELPPAPEDGAAEADEINAKTRGWLYRISSFDADILMQSRDDFVETAEAEAPAS